MGGTWPWRGFEGLSVGPSGSQATSVLQITAQPKTGESPGRHCSPPCPVQLDQSPPAEALLMFCFLDWALKGSELGLRKAATQWRSQGGKPSRLVAAKGLQFWYSVCFCPPQPCKCFHLISVTGSSWPCLCLQFGLLHAWGAMFKKTVSGKPKGSAWRALQARVCSRAGGL